VLSALVTVVVMKRFSLLSSLISCHAMCHRFNVHETLVTLPLRLALSPPSIARVDPY
jgi:hypothetical protein